MPYVENEKEPLIVNSREVPMTAILLQVQLAANNQSSVPSLAALAMADPRTTQHALIRRR